MKKEDYMKLSKERLAELLEDRDNGKNSYPVFPPPQIAGNPPCYAPDGICTNQFHDCINCPKMTLTRGSTTF